MWWKIFGDTSQWLLSFIYTQIHGVAVFDVIGPYGLAIIVMTILVAVVLAPLQQFQLVTQRRTMVEQRKLAPEVAELRKKYRKEPQKLNTEMMKLYQEHGVNPLAGFVGCLPLLIQMPILYALFYVFRNWAPSAHVISHFLFIPDLNRNPKDHPLITLFGIGIPTVAYAVIPLLAAVTTFVQTKMLQMPPPPNPTEQELQQLQMQRTMVWMSPVMIAFFSLQVPAGLGLYWLIRNCVSIIQQSFVVGWGTLVPSRFRTVAGGAPASPSRGPSLANPGTPSNKGQASQRFPQPNNPGKGQPPPGRGPGRRNGGKRKRRKR